MRLLVTGGRDFIDEAQVNRVLDHIHAKAPISVLIHGGANGADYLAAEWACKCSVFGVPVERYQANWDKHGRAAGPIRNAQMLSEGKPDLVVAFAGGAGTRNMVALAEEAGVRVIQCPPAR